MIADELKPLLEQFHKCLAEVADAELRVQSVYFQIDTAWHQLQMAQLTLAKDRQLVESLARQLWVKLVEAGVLTNPCPEYKPGGGLVRSELELRVLPGTPRVRATIPVRQEEEC